MSVKRRPLEGIRVLELAQVVAGPFCGTLMAEFGAEVIKTEIPGKGDDLRRLGPSEDGTSYWFATDNRNKKLMTLDLHTPAGQDIVRRLVAKCDVVLENFRPGVLEKWGLGWLRHRDLTGEGQWIDAALYESAFRVLEYTTTAYGRRGLVRERGGLQHSGWPGGAFQTQDGHWVVFTAPAQHLFERLCAMLGQPDLPKDPRFATAEERPKHIPLILEMATAWFAARPFDMAIEGLKTHDIPHSPIMSIADIFTDPHFRERDMLLDVPDEKLGMLKQPGVVPKLSLTPGRVDHAGASLGRHTDEILTGLLEMSPADIATLRKDGVI